MNDSIVFQLEDLPNEILIEISQYFSIRELYSSFSYLNTHLDSIVKALPNLILIIKSHQDPVLSFFHSFDIVKIDFDHSKLSSLSQLNFSKFIGIRSFSICPSISVHDYIEPIDQLERFIRPDLCPQLQSLQIPYCSQTLASWIFNGTFRHLKICQLYDDIYSDVILSSLLNNRLHALRELTIKERDGDEFEQILLLCPNLTYLHFSCNSVLPPFIEFQSPYSSLKRLRLLRIVSFLFHQFDDLLSLFPNLIDFDLTVDQCRVNDELINFNQMAQYLCHRVPHLRVLKLRIYMTNRTRSSFSRRTFKRISQMHPLFKCIGRTGRLVNIASFDFTSTYYYDHWFVRMSSE
jgi:hypothetical protein